MVDDQPRIAERVREMLSDDGEIVFHYCREADKALAEARRFGPTVILQDLVMPGTEGLALVRLFKAHPMLREVPLVVLSSREEASTKAEAFANGADDYLVKLPEGVEMRARVRYHSRHYLNVLQKKEAFSALEESQGELRKEIARAAAYVTSLLPPPIFEGPIGAEWGYHPSSTLGGDSLGYHWIDGNRFAVYLLDVSGHGVGPALLSVSVLNTIRSQTLHGADFRDPGSVLFHLNEAYQMKHHDNLYFTMWYGVFDRRESVLSFAGAGHPPPVLLQGDGRTERLVTQNVIVGMERGADYRCASVRISRPAFLYVFSDGVFEIRRPDGTYWSYGELEKRLGEDRTGEGDLDDLYRHVGEVHGRPVLEDDFSILRVSFR